MKAVATRSRRGLGWSLPQSLWEPALPTPDLGLPTATARTDRVTLLSSATQFVLATPGSSPWCPGPRDSGPHPLPMGQG